jgi:hypothetical protein
VLALNVSEVFGYSGELETYLNAWDDSHFGDSFLVIWMLFAVSAVKMQAKGGTDDNLSMLNSQSSCIVAAFAALSKHIFKCIHRCSIRSVSNCMDVDLKSGIKPLTR